MHRGSAAPKASTRKKKRGGNRRADLRRRHRARQKAEESHLAGQVAMLTERVLKMELCNSSLEARCRTLQRQSELAEALQRQEADQEVLLNLRYLCIWACRAVKPL